MSKVMILKSGCVNNFEIEEIEGKKVNLEYLQSAVDGYIEIPYFSKELDKKGIDMVINEEGKLEGLEPTIVIMRKGEIVDLVVGTVVFCGHNSSGSSVGLTGIQVAFVEKTLKETTGIKNAYDDNGWIVRVLNI